MKRRGRPPKYTAEQVRGIRKAYAMGAGVRVLARAHKVDVSAMWRLLNRVTYQWVD